MENKQFEMPEIEIVNFDSNDIIVTSGEPPCAVKAPTIGGVS